MTTTVETRLSHTSLSAPIPERQKNIRYGWGAANSWGVCKFQDGRAHV